ncbi:MAG: CSLREA domain-containing protein [Thermoflexales bacterium]|nr:CSLREA domain-containing protein [Thermoflexales bacterium]
MKSRPLGNGGALVTWLVPLAWGLGLALLACLWLDGGAPTARAASAIRVTTTEDELDANGRCSLREAIQAANLDTGVDGCPAGSGDDTITLPAGIYTLTLAGQDEDGNQAGDLDIAGTGALTLTGEGAGQTIVNANGIDRILDIHPGAGTVVISGVTLYNGYLFGYGGGIQAAGTSLSLINTAIISSFAVNGGGLYVSQGRATLEEGQIVSNIASKGGGVCVWSSGAAFTLLAGGVVAYNQADNGGGVYVRSGVASLQAGLITANTAGMDGGGIYIDSGQATLEGTPVVSNTAANGGGVYVRNPPASFVQAGRDSLVAHNRAGSGGGVFVLEGSARLEGGHITHNRADWGGGLYINAGQARLDGISLSLNQARLDGGGVYIQRDTGILSQTAASDILSNTAGASGGGVYVWDGQAVLEGGQVSSNTAALHGGGIYVGPGRATLDGPLVGGNAAAQHGGGGYVASGKLELRSGRVAGNAAGVGGGGLYVESGHAELAGGQVASNTAAYGGGVYILYGRTVLGVGEVTRNAARQAGGGVYLYGKGSRFVQGNPASLVSHNTAGNGEGLYIARGSARLEGGTINELFVAGGELSLGGVVTVSGDVYQAGGVVDGGDGTLRIEGALSLSGGAFQAPAGGLTIAGPFTHTGGVYRQARLVDGSAEAAFPKAGGLVIDTGGREMGRTQVHIRAGVDCTTVAGETARRCFAITPTQAAQAQITFFFHDADLGGGRACHDVQVYTWDNGWGSALGLDPSYGLNGRACGDSPYSLRVVSVTNFSPFVLAGGAPTAITLSTARPKPANAVWAVVLLLLVEAVVIRGSKAKLLRFAWRRFAKTRFLDHFSTRPGPIGYTIQR